MIWRNGVGKIEDKKKKIQECMNEKWKTIILAMLIAGIITGIFVVQIFSTSFAISEADGGNMSPSDFDNSAGMVRDIGIIVAIGGFFGLTFLFYMVIDEMKKRKKIRN